MAEARKKSTITKTKTVPAKKPATKPAGKSVKPKNTKTIKTRTSSKTTATTKSSNTSTKVDAKKQCNLCKIIFAVIVALAVVSVVIWAVVCIANNSGDTILIENGKGDKISMVYTSPENSAYRVLVPANFKKLSAEELKSEYGATDAEELAYVNPDDTVAITIGTSDNDLSNDQIKDYLATMKIVFSIAAKVLDNQVIEADGNNVGVISYIGEVDNEKVYNKTAFFSNNGKLAVVTFTCDDSARAEWEKVGEEVIKSINFIK